MKSEIGQTSTIIGGLFVTSMVAGGFLSASGPGSGFISALVMAGGAGLLTLTPVNFWWRILCVLVLISSLYWAKSEWDAREDFKKRMQKQIIEDFRKSFTGEPQ